VAFEIEREEEFSPLKNASGAGKDCPETCRRDLYNLHRRYLVQAGGQISPGDQQESDAVEISPLVTYAGEGLEWVRGKHFGLPLLLDCVPS